MDRYFIFVSHVHTNTKIQFSKGERKNIQPVKAYETQ